MSRRSFFGISTARLLLWSLAAIIVIASIAPGWPLDTPSGMIAKLQAKFFSISNSWFLPSLFERFVFFFPLGYLFYATREKPTGILSLLRILVLLVLFCALVEFLQLFIVGRHPRYFDLVAAICMSTGGAILAAWVYGRGMEFDARRALLGVLAVINIFLVVSIYAFEDGSEMRGWDCDAPLLLGNENQTLKRAWAGQLGGLAFYPVPLSQSEALALRDLPFSADPEEGRRQAGALVVYDFAHLEGDEVRPVFATAEAAPIRVPAGVEVARDAAGRLTLEGGAAVSAQPWTGVCQAMLRARAFSVEIGFAPATTSQDGPARIVSQSQDVRNGNFLLGQVGEKLHLRVKTARTGPYGAARPLETPALLEAGEWHHVVATFDDGLARIFVDGALTAETHVARHVWLARSYEMPLAIAIIPVFLVLGALSSHVAPGGGPAIKLLFALLLGSAASVAAVLVIAWHAGRPADGALILAALVGPLVGTGLSATVGAMRRG